MNLNPLVLMREEVDKTGVVFDPENNKAMMINKVGVFIWHAIEDGLTEEEILDKITHAFNVDNETAAEDLARFLELLRKKGLLLG